jgi:hypothetical protein
MKGEIVYIHRNKRTGDIFYVGKGANRGRAYDEYSRPKKWYDIVNKDYFDVEIISSGLSKEDAFELEALAIETIGFEKLTNLTKGGKGVLGFKHSKETKQKQSLSAKRRWDNVDYSKTAKLARATRCVKRDEYFKHRITGEIICGLSIACEKYNIKYRGEYQRVSRNSYNRSFDKIDYNHIK